MTDKDKLRDARLARALQHMPDAHMQPSADARMAVLKRAQEAVASRANTAPPATQRWWQSASPGAWGGVLASVLVASFITLMWYGQPVPDANPDMPTVSGKPESAAPAIAPQSTLPKSPPVIPMAEAKKTEPQVVAQPKQEAMRKAREPTARKAVALPTPAPTPLDTPYASSLPPPPPEPSANALELTPSDSLANAAPTTSARSSMPLRKISPESAYMARNELIYIQSGNQLRRVRASDAAALLAYLRALPPPTAGAATELRVTPATDMVTPSITIRTVQGDHWDVWPMQLRVQAATADKADPATPPQVFAISPLQYETLRSLIDRVSPQ